MSSRQSFDSPSLHREHVWDTSFWLQPTGPAPDTHVQVPVHLHLRYNAIVPLEALSRVCDAFRLLDRRAVFDMSDARLTATLVFESKTHQEWLKRTEDRERLAPAVARAFTPCWMGDADPEVHHLSLWELGVLTDVDLRGQDPVTRALGVRQEAADLYDPYDDDDEDYALDEV